jgi:aspartyl-tRNA(Asn)/glutamyl-tRNA(Gln) amidotransferase subunit A
MSSHDLHYLSIADAARLIQSGKLSPVELVQALLARIGQLDHRVQAFITLTADRALAAARKAEQEIQRGQYRGPLHGIPFGLKDIYDTAGLLTSGGSAVCADNVPAQDATVTRKLLDAGAILLGKLQTHEFAHGGPSFDLPWPPSRNPWDLSRFTGGSSSGSGAALAAGFMPAAMGSDTGGSIRGPASFCGITGLMPTYGLVSRAGVIPNSFTFDHCGPMARSAEDCAILLQAVAGYDAADPGSIRHEPVDFRSALDRPVQGLRVGVLRHYWEEDIPATAEHARALEEAVKVFESLGATVSSCRIRPVQEGFDIKVVIAESEIFSIHQENLIRSPEKFGRDFLGRALPACVFQSADYVQALREHRRYLDELRPVFERFDVLLASGFGPAPRFEDYRTENFWLKSNVCTPANTGRTPALALPCGYTSSGLPLGMQLIGRAGDDARVLQAGHAFQQATDWHLRRAPLTGGEPLPAPDLQANEPKPSTLSAAMQSHVEQMALQADLKLNQRQMMILMENAPHALAMAARLRKPRDRMEQPSLVFRFD